MLLPKLISVTHVSRYAVRACQSQVLSERRSYTELGCFGSVAGIYRGGVSQAKILFLKIKTDKNKLKNSKKKQNQTVSMTQSQIKDREREIEKETEIVIFIPRCGLC